jgi:hypothetical protein
VVVARLIGRHQLAGHVAVAARPDDAVDEDRRGRVGVLVADLLRERHGGAVDGVERYRVVAQHRAPVRVRAPGRRVEDEAGAALARDREEARKREE